MASINTTQKANSGLAQYESGLFLLTFLTLAALTLITVFIYIYNSEQHIKGQTMDMPT